MLLLFRKGTDIFSKSGTLFNQQEIVDLLMFANRHFSRKMAFFWYVYCLLMIVSFDTIKCGRQIYFFQQETVVVVETCEIPLFIFF